MKKKYLLKEGIFWISVLGIFLFFLTEFFTKQSVSVCFKIGTYSYETSCRLVGDIALISFPIFLFSIFISFFKRKEYFEAWKKFTFIYLFIYLFIVIITPWDLGDIMSIQKDVMTISFCIFYTIISLLVILRNSFILKNQLTHWWSKSLYYILGFILINAIMIVSGLFYFLINH